MAAREIFEKAEKERGSERLEEAIALYQEARDQALKEKDRGLAAESLHMIGVINYQQGEFANAKAYLDSAVSEFIKISDNEMKAVVLRDVGLCQLKMDQVGEALVSLSESVELLKNSDKKGHLGISNVKLGKAFTKDGKVDRGLSWIEEGIENIKQSPDRFFESIAYFDLAEGLKKQCDLIGAKEAAQKSLDILNSIASQDEHLKRKEEIRKFINSILK